jgi:Kef-type K+ transport system membrane component KefB
VFGLLVGGICLGPSVLGILSPESPVVELFSELGKLLLMFFAGFEINLQQVKKQGGKTVGFGLLTFAIPMAAGTAVAHFLGYGLNTSVLVGSLMASHTLLGLPAVKKLGLMNNTAVLVAVGATIITDVLSMLVLAICVMLHLSGFSPAHLYTILIQLAIFVPLIVFGLSWVAKQLMKRTSTPEIRMGIFILMLCVASLMAEAIQLEGIVGAFLAGIALNRALGEDRSPGHPLEIVSQTRFIPVFFLSTGFLVDLKVFFGTLIQHSEMVMLIVVGLLLAKYLAARIAGFLFKLGKNESKVMWSLSVPQVAATLAAAIVAYWSINGAGDRLLDKDMLNAIVVLVVVTSVLGPILTRRYGSRIESSVDQGTSAGDVTEVS